MKLAPITIIATLILIIAAPHAHALLDKTFYSSDQILPGEEWNAVYVYNNDTVVDMLGGFVEGLGTYDASTINVTAGSINGLNAHQFSTANVSGGTVLTLAAYDSGTVKLFPSGTVFSLDAAGAGTAYMSGGITEYARTGDSSTLNLYGGTVTNYLNAWDSATVNVYGYGFNYSPSGGSWNGGQLTGFWLDGTPFTIDLYDAQTYSHINLIPEPATILFLGLGGLVAHTAFNKTSNCHSIETRHLRNAERRTS
ncbi:MAG TPA: hypothetical protein VMW16_03130 [Sedimentisphaerales bacterium]|nr:hypothetical protein [Sedimentisphaerales bacterium]